MTDRELIRLAKLWSEKALGTMGIAPSIYLSVGYPNHIDDATCLAQQLYCEQVYGGGR